MIDWLEEVLKRAQSEEEQNRLLELLGQVVVAAAAKRPAAVEEEGPSQGEAAPGAPTPGGVQALSVEHEAALAALLSGNPPSDSAARRWLEAALERLAPRQIQGEDGKIPPKERQRELGTELPVGGLSAGEEPVLLSRLRDVMDSGTMEKARQLMGDGVLMAMARRAMGQALPNPGTVDTGESYPAGTLPAAGEQSGLGSLYRRMAQAVTGAGTTPAAVSPVVIREEQVVSAGLTAGELDRAVRRDSRRYDGRMNIY